MATVIFARGLRQYTGGNERVDVAPGTIRDVMRELTRRYPDLREPLASGTAVSIDGEIISDPLLEEVSDESEVHFVPSISGGQGQGR